MKKKVLMSLVVLAIIGTSAVFAQSPTLDKLKFTGRQGGGLSQQVEAANQQISGAVVIPDTYDGKPVTHVGGFKDITGITSVTIPASVTTMVNNAFYGCTNLTSVNFLGEKINMATNNNYNFPGDLPDKYKAGGAGTYTRQAGSNTWTKQGGFTLNGEWTRSDGMKITISGDGTQTFTITGNAPNNGGRFTRNFAER